MIVSQAATFSALNTSNFDQCFRNIFGNSVVILLNPGFSMLDVLACHRGKMSLKQFCFRCTPIGFPPPLPPPLSPSRTPFLPFSAVIGFCIKSRKGIKVFHFNSSYASRRRRRPTLDRVKPEQTLGSEGRKEGSKEGRRVLHRIDLCRLVAMVHFRGNHFLRDGFSKRVKFPI